MAYGGLVTGYTLFVSSPYYVIFTFANQRFCEVCWRNMNIQGCQSSGRQGEQQNSGGQWKLIKNKNLLPLMFVSVHQQCWLKNNNRDYGKSFWIFWVPEKLQWICFKSILINHEITNDPVMKRHLRPRCSHLKGQKAMPPPCLHPPSSGVPVHIYTHSLYSL